MLNIIVLILYLSFIMLFWQFIGYPLFMYTIIKMKSQHEEYTTYKQFVSIIVPAYNEEKNIQARIDNLIELDYDRDYYEIIIVESGSKDNTFLTVEKYISTHAGKPQIRIVREIDRKGKASAINFGKTFARGDIILVTDANSTLDKNVLKFMLPHFENPKIGAVSGRFILSNPENEIVNSSSFYWNLEVLMRKGESLLDSVCFFHGEINAWRKDIVEADTSALSEDLDMSIKIRKAGYRIYYEPKALVFEKGPTTNEEQIKQKKRTALGTIQNLFKHRYYLLKSVNFYSYLIIPSHKSLQVLSPFFLIGFVSSIIILLSLGEFIFVTRFLLLSGIVNIILLIFLLKIISIESKDVKTSKVGSFHPARIIWYVLLHEYLVLLAWKDFLSGEYSVLWEKVESTR
jgi:cellulose synthase/poly-beta-1,6-N-acetylglucosamine synthase-like glycosyltransferase